MALLNPMGITSGVWQGNAQQSDYRVPTVNANVASYAIGADILGDDWSAPPTQYSQPGTSAPAAGSPAFPLGPEPA